MRLRAEGLRQRLRQSIAPTLKLKIALDTLKPCVKPHEFIHIKATTEHTESTEEYKLMFED
jgi:hypothetical protein